MADFNPVGCRTCGSWVGSCRGYRRGCPVEHEFRSKKLRAAIWLYVMIAILIGVYIYTHWNITP